MEVHFYYGKTYKKRKQGETVLSLSKEYQITSSKINYL